MPKIILILLFIPLFTFSYAQTLTGFVSDKANQPLEGVLILIDKKPELETNTNEVGYFELNVDNQDLSNAKIVFQKNQYKEKIIPLKKFTSGMVITLETVFKSDVIYADDEIELTEAVIYSTFKIDSLARINSYLTKANQNFIHNYPLHPTTYRVDGFHSLSEKVNPKREDTLMYVKSPFYIDLTSYTDEKLYLNSNILINPDATLYVKNPEYNVPKNSPFFLNDQINWINLYKRDFFTKRKNYTYKIVEENADFITISFKIKKPQLNSWSGSVTINKEDFAITKVELDLEFNRKNSYTIVSQSVNKNATSLIYFEGAKITWKFSKAANNIYKISELDSKYRIIHVGANSEYTPQFIVNTQMKFKPATTPEDHKLLALNELLYMLFHKNYNP